MKTRASLKKRTPDCKIVRLCIKNNAGKTGWVNAPTKKWVK